MVKKYCWGLLDIFFKVAIYFDKKYPFISLSPKHHVKIAYTWTGPYDYITNQGLSFTENFTPNFTLHSVGALWLAGKFWQSNHSAANKNYLRGKFGPWSGA